ncbi:Probable splicing factor 3B subunit 3 [Durusdinium trenchii]|uniref:Probable splicing factor 3B subunit 3 n=1 Tax=Durusdinium trenchii TaxID=1381693 RepID=A0ABP0ISY9_9DINO
MKLLVKLIFTVLLLFLLSYASVNSILAEKTRPSPAAVVSSELRVARARVARVALCLLALDAEAYIDEWVHFHEALGVDHFFVFDLANQLELNDWASGKAHVNVTHFPAKNITDVHRFRAELEKRCIQMARRAGYSWVGLLDVDEFILFPQEFETHIAELLERRPPSESSLPLPGRLFASDAATYQPLPVTKRVMQFVDMNWTRSLVRTDPRRRQSLGSDREPEKDPSQEPEERGVVTLNCYWKKSIKELYKKCSQSPSKELFAHQCLAKKLRRNQPLRRDDMAWTFLKRKVPYYAGFDLMLPISEPRYPTEHGSLSDTGCALCAIMLNEEAYVDEWVDYHLALGMSHIFLYDNSKTWELQRWASRRLKVTSVHWSADAGQEDAYVDCWKKHVRPKNYTWVAFWDVDEFLILKDHRNVIDYLAEYLDHGSLSPNWLMFGPAGHKVYEPKPVTKRFQKSESKVNRHVKTISRSEDVRQPHVHYALLWKGAQRDAAGLQLKKKGSFNEFNGEGLQSQALIFHYVYKSHKELVKKRWRGRADVNMTTKQRRIRMKDDRHIDQCCPRLEHRAWERIIEYLPHYQMYDQPIDVIVKLRRSRALPGAKTGEKACHESDLEDLGYLMAALCLTVCYFSQLANQPCLVVGTVYNMTLYPRHAPKATIKTYMYDERYHLQLIHSTPLDDVPLCLFPFEGRLLASVGKNLRVYELGKRKLLRKCEYKNIPEGLMWMHVKGDKIFAGDLRESFHIFKYRRTDNQLFVLADDQAPRWMTCATVLDSTTMAGADKFDNFFVCRIPEEARDDEGGDHTGLRLKADTAYLTGATPKLDSIVQFHVGDTVTALEKTTLAQGGSELICYSTLLGAIGAFYPFAGKDELDFFQHLEMFVRAEKPPLCGRDHIMYRSYHFPVQNCVDGDLCEQFMTLSAEKQRLIASELDRTPAEIIKKLEERAVRSRAVRPSSRVVESFLPPETRATAVACL